MQKYQKRKQLVLNIVFILICLICILPFLLVLIASFTDNNTLLKEGYSFFPGKLSMEAYRYLMVRQAGKVWQAYWITTVITVIGSIVGISITTMLGYVISNRNFPYRKALQFFVFFTMLFSGGLVPTYILYTKYLNMKNTLLALIVPNLLTNGMYVLIMRTFFQTNIPDSILESAEIDGASEIRTFISIVLPLSLPIMATVGLLLIISYWNSWYNCLIYVTKERLYTIQSLLSRILLNIQFLMTAGESGVSAGESADLPMQSVRMAMAVVGALPLLCVYPFFQKYFVKGLLVGAVKG